MASAVRATYRVGDMLSREGGAGGRRKLARRMSKVGRKKREERGRQAVTE